ncbi:unnamed protein product, partial [Notodromas monacha]
MSLEFSPHMPRAISESLGNLVINSSFQTLCCLLIIAVFRLANTETSSTEYMTTTEESEVKPWTKENAEKDGHSDVSTAEATIFSIEMLPIWEPNYPGCFVFCKDDLGCPSSFHPVRFRPMDARPGGSSAIPDWHGSLSRVTAPEATCITPKMEGAVILALTGRVAPWVPGCQPFHQFLWNQMSHALEICDFSEAVSERQKMRLQLHVKQGLSHVSSVSILLHSAEKQIQAATKCWHLHYNFQRMHKTASSLKDSFPPIRINIVTCVFRDKVIDSKNYPIMNSTFCFRTNRLQLKITQNMTDTFEAEASPLPGYEEEEGSDDSNLLSSDASPFLRLVKRSPQRNTRCGSSCLSDANCPTNRRCKTCCIWHRYKRGPRPRTGVCMTYYQGCQRPPRSIITMMKATRRMLCCLLLVTIVHLATAELSFISQNMTDTFEAEASPLPGYEEEEGSEDSNLLSSDASPFLRLVKRSPQRNTRCGSSCLSDANCPTNRRCKTCCIWHRYKRGPRPRTGVCMTYYQGCQRPPIHGSQNSMPNLSFENDTNNRIWKNFGQISDNEISKQDFVHTKEINSTL